MTIGPLIRDLRLGRRWSQGQLADRLCAVSGRPSLTREDVSRWERGKVIPGRYWIDHLATALDVPAEAIREAATLAQVDRRAFLSLTALTAIHGPLAAEMVASMAGADPIPLTEVQTTHGTDLVIASKVDPPAAVRLRRWMRDGDTAVLRVNAAGILAKVPGRDDAADVARVLEHDAEVRELYTTAVLARVCVLDWTTARRLAVDPLAFPKKVGYLANRLAGEVINPRDAGARWASATVLRDLSPAL